MFESIVSTLINRFLGSYIENFDSKSLNIGIWSGDVRLKNLTLKKESLDKFKLPLDVKFGHLGELTLQIPWSNLKGKPVKVIIEDVYLLASPIILADFDADDDKKRTQQIKQEKLKDLEALQSAINSNEQNLPAGNESFTESLITKIVDNLQVTIKNIHVRYEDDSVLTENPYSLGFTLAELSAASTDENWSPSFIAITQSFTRKLLVLRNFACYMNTESSSIYTEDRTQLLKALKACFSLSNEAFQYLLNPVSGEGHLVIHKSGATDSHPHVRAELFFDEFGIDFDSHQYRDILWTALKFHWYQKTWKFRKLRPKTALQDAPRDWFAYAAQSVVNEIHEKNYKWSWDHFRTRRDQRKAYIRLWKQKLLKCALPLDEEKEFGALEEILSYEDIKFYRSLTRAEIRKENLVAPPPQPQPTAASSGWFSSWWGGGAQNGEASTQATEDDGGLNLALSEEQRKALYETIDYNENQTPADLDTPRDRVTMEVFVNLKKGGISLKLNKDSPALAEVVIEGCQTQFFQRPDSFLANFQLQEFKIEDGTTNPLYKHIVSVKHDHSQLHSHSPESSTSTEEPFFQFSFENNPLDGSADSSLLAKLKSMTIFYNYVFVEEIINFFKPPTIHLDTVGAIMNAAEATMEGLTAQTRIGLQYALEEHKTINVKLDLQAPLLILPLDPKSWKSPVAIFDAGHLSVTSDLVDKRTIEMFSTKKNHTEEDWSKLNTLMYDTFKLHLQDAQFLVGPTIKDTMEQLHTKKTKNSAVILDNFDFKLALGISILPSATNLAKIKVSGEVPGINLALSDFQYKAIMQLVDKLIPAPENVENESSSVFDTFGNNGKLEEIEDVDNASRSSSKAPSQQDSQHAIEIDFKVDTVVLAMYRCIDGITLETEHLIDIIGDSLNFSFYKTENDMHVDLSLTDINLVDHIETSGIKEFEKLVSSNSFLEEEAVKRKNPELFKLGYDRIQRIVEHNGRDIEVFDQDIVLDMTALKCVVSRKSLLSLLNFVLNTFTDANAESTPADELNHNDATDDTVAPQKINVLVNLDSIIVVLNEDGIKLATLQLSTALIKVLVLPVELEVNGKLGALSLHDESNQGLPRNSVFRKLVSIEGDNLAEFSYKTFDPETHTEPYQSYVEFITGATKINFVEDAFVKIFSYLNKFQRMKAIYDSAREAAINQASHIDNASKIKMNILVRAPIVHFPKIIDLEGDKCDLLVAELGELYLNNVFELKSGVLHNIIQTGFRNININTLFDFEDNVVQSGKIVENLDVKFDIDYVEDNIDDVPNFVVTGKTQEINMKLTELQLRYMNNLQNSISNAFNVSDDDSLDDIEEDADQANAVMKHNTSENKTANDVAQQISEARAQNESKPVNPDRETIVLKFDIPKVSLTLYNRTKSLRDFESKKLCSLAVNSFGLSFRMKEDSHFEADVSISSFTISDVREGTENKFTEIIPPIDGEKQQFLLNASTSGEGDSKTTTLMLTVEEPRTVLALDHIFELQAFANKGLELEPSVNVRNVQGEENGSIKDSKFNGEYALQEDSVVEAQNETSSTSMFGISVNVINPSVILLADSTKADTEALVFKVEQVLFTSQNIFSLAVKNVGMYVVKMDTFEDQRMRIIDDFSMSFALDSRGSTPTEFLTSIQLSVDPLLLRISLHDIRLAMRIAEKANEYYSQAQAAVSEDDKQVDYSISEEFKRKLSNYAPSTVSSMFGASRKFTKDPNTTEVTVRGEEFETVIGGARLVLIGDVHELPVLDMGIKPFEVKVTNWSTDLNAEAQLESYINIYNYSKSTWEPLLENWQMAIYASKVLLPQPRMMIEVVSREIAQLSISSRSVALLSQIAASITADVAPKSREQIAPYIIENETGFDIEVWTDRDDETSQNKHVIPLGGKISWEFEDWRTIRENLDTDNKSDVLGVKLLGSNYEEIRKISASGEGEELFALYPPVNGVHNRLVSEISLGSDNVKTIRLRSTVSVKNNAEIAIAVQMTLKSGGSDIELIVEPGEQKALPIDVVYHDRFKIKPQMETRFNWSNESLDWKTLMQGGVPLQCSSIGNGELSSYFFQAEAQYNAHEPLAKIYPHLTVVISAPLEIENLLPFDFNFRLYDKSSKKDWNGTVEKGKSSFIQVVTLQSLLLLSVEPRGCGFGKSEFAIINAKKDTGFKRESFTTVKNENGQTVKLKMYYPKNQASKTSLKVVIYSPYVVLNRTGQDLHISENSKHSQVVAMGSHGEENTPHIFSFEKDSERLSRALAKLGDSAWSSPLSFDAIGQVTGMSVQVPGKNIEKNFGVSIAEGEGKYNLTKVITFAPRYIMRNCLEEPVMIAENGSTKQFQIGPGELFPLYNLRKTEQKTMLLKFIREGHWTSPFAINDIGQIFLKAQKESVGQVLLKVNIITENATIFVQIENANNAWPFSIRNFTDSEFFLYQSNPNTNLNGEIVKKDVDYKPIYYKVPAKSVMPYSYDYPNAVVKEIIIRSHGRERSINLAEIGNLKPFRLPQTSEHEQAIVDLNVVADGPTQSLVITKYDPSLSLYKLQDASNSTSNVSQQNFEVDEKDENYYTKIFTRFEGFGISFINTRSQELCYLSLRGVELRYNESDLYQNLSMKLKWIQLDNQLYGGIFPIIIYPTLVPKSGKEMNSHPSFSASVCKVKDESHGVLFIKYATILLQEMSIEVDEDFLFALLDFSKFPGASWNTKVEDKLCDENLEIPEPKKLSEASDIYFEALHLQPALTNLSFVRTERVNAEDRSTSQNTLMFFVNMLTMAIGNINDAPIKLNALFIENIRVPIPILMESISTHYGQSFFYQLHKILGSADFLGNPVGLFNNLSSGVLDIFYEPYQGFVINDRPQEIGIGIAKGGLSFIKKSVFGFSDSFAKVTGSLAKGLSVATMDRKFQERRRLNQRRNRPKHALYGFTSGANSFFDSITSGVTGIAQAPIEGATKEGAGGFFKGLGKGVIGLPTKTAIGIFDLASNVSEGIRNTTTVFDADGLEKVRLPRYISYDEVIRPYSAREAQGQFWLKSIDGGSLFEESYVAHLILPGEEKSVLVTFKKIILFELNSLKTSWIVSFENVRGISLETTGISIILNNKKGPFLPIPEKKSRIFLYNKMKVAVEKYNSRCQVEL